MDGMKNEHKDQLERYENRITELVGDYLKLSEKNMGLCEKHKQEIIDIHKRHEERL